MKLTVERRYKCNGYTIGRLLIDEAYFCDTLEDADRGLSNTMTMTEIMSSKVKSCTAIPTGTYQVALNLKSPKFGDHPFYKQVCGGKLPRILGVKGFQGVLIHCGNTAKDTDGCILVGENKVKGQVINSRDTFRKLMAVLKLVDPKHEDVTIEVK